MATYKTRAIVINRYNFGEADRIVVFLTPSQGVVRAVAKGVRKIKSRMAGHLELFSIVDLMLAQGRNLDVITSARLQGHATRITKDYERLQIAYLCAEMVDKLSGEREHHDGQFETVEHTLEALDNVELYPATIELWLKLRLLNSLGYKPELDGCSVCGLSSVGKDYAFSDELGGIVCSQCKTTTSAPVNHEQIKLWRLALSHSVSSLQKVSGSQKIAVDSLPILNQFYEYTFSRTFRSQEMLA